MSLNSILLNVHLYCRLQKVCLRAKKALTKVFAKYAYFADIFSLNLMSKLLEHTKINNYAIKQVDN